MTEPAVAPPSRNVALDGLRGWAALSVVIYHACWETFGVVFPPFRSYVSSLVGDGSLAVAIFFCLSGYVLTIGRWRRHNSRALWLVLLRRYVRLEIPILVAALIFWAILSLGWSGTQVAAPIVHREDWLGSFGGFTPDFVDALRFAAMRTFWVVREHSYGPFLWTMAIELLGSVVVLVLSHSPRALREPYSVLLLCIVLLLRFFPLATCFPVGALVALMQRDGVFFARPPTRIEGVLATLVLVATLLIAGVLQMTFASLLPISIAGMVILAATLRSPMAQALLNTPVSAWMGTASFPLYLVQIFIFMTVTSWSIVWLDARQLLTPWTALGVVIATVLAALVAAWAFLPVERLTLAVVSRLGRREPRAPLATLGPAP